MHYVRKFFIFQYESLIVAVKYCLIFRLILWKLKLCECMTYGISVDKTIFMLSDTRKDESFHFIRQKYSQYMHHSKPFHPHLLLISPLMSVDKYTLNYIQLYSWFFFHFFFFSHI